MGLTQHRILAMADTPNPGIASLEMLLERLSAIESHTRIATAFRQYDAETLPAGSELTSDMYDCGTFFRINKLYEGRLRTCVAARGGRGQRPRPRCARLVLHDGQGSTRPDRVVQRLVAA